MFLFLEVKRNTTDKATGVRIRIGIVAGLYIKSVNSVAVNRFCTEK